MPTSPASSTPSAVCRLELPPSRPLALALAGLGLFAAAAVLLSEMPPAHAWPLALAACGQGLILARVEMHRPVRCLQVAAGGQVSLDGRPLSDVALEWRGPWLFVRGRDPDGRLHRLHRFPDVTDPALRRELRLAMRTRGPSPAPESMAP